MKLAKSDSRKKKFKKIIIKVSIKILLLCGNNKTN